MRPSAGGPTPEDYGVASMQQKASEALDRTSPVTDDGSPQQVGTSGVEQIDRTNQETGMTKGERREARQRKERYGMRVTNTSIRLIAKLATQPKEKSK